MQIMDEHSTIQYLIDHRASIARYGDGELKLCTGRRAKSQVCSAGIQNRMREILVSRNNNNCLVGIPRIYSSEDKCRMSERKWSFWKNYANDKHLPLYDKYKLYGSAFITRPDAAPGIDNAEYYAKIKSLWKDREVLILHGKGTGFLKSPSLLDGVKKYQEAIGPPTNAYSEHKSLLKRMLLTSDRDTIILISLGPEATILAWDLACNERQALDLGHLGMFYAHIHPKDKQWDGVDRGPY